MKFNFSQTVRSATVYYPYSELPHHLDHDAYFLDEIKKVSWDIKTLRLSGDPFYLKGDVLEQAVKLVKPVVRTLNLELCGLYQVKNLGKIFESIPATVNSINLDYNRLDTLPVEQLEEIFSKLPSGVKNISLLSFERIDSEKINMIMRTLPENVNTVMFEKDKPIDRMDWMNESYSNSMRK